MARALGVALSGPRSYDGRMQAFPWVHPDGARDAGPAAIDGAVSMLWRVWAVLLAVSLLIWLA